MLIEAAFDATNRDAPAAREVIVAAIDPFADYQRTSAMSAFGTKHTSGERLASSGKPQCGLLSLAEITLSVVLTAAPQLH